MKSSQKNRLIPVRFADGKYGLGVRRGGKLIPLDRWFHILDNEDRRRAFRWRQVELIAGSLPWLALATAGVPWALSLVALLITVARDEALRFRTTGKYFQTRRSLWVGSNPHDQ